MTKNESVEKEQSHINQKAMAFPVVMYGCESWTIKKAECQRIDAFELWCWRRLLRVPWTARRSKQSILKEISSEYSLEELMLNLQYFGYLRWKTDSLEKTLMLGKSEGRRRRGPQRNRWLGSITDLIDISEQVLGVGDGQGSLEFCTSLGCKKSDIIEQLNWAHWADWLPVFVTSSFFFSYFFLSDLLGMWLINYHTRPLSKK